MHDAELVEGAGLGGPVTGLACNGQGGLVEGGGLIPVAVGAQEAAIAAGMATACRGCARAAA